MSHGFDVHMLDIEELFTDSADFPCFFVPHYQRGFSWKRPEISELIADIDVARKEQADGYFIGPVTIVLTEANNRFDIIDGQQRLTTIALIINQLSLDLLSCGNRTLQRRSKQHLIVNDNDVPKISHLRQDDAAAFKQSLEIQQTANRSHISDATEIIRSVLHRKLPSDNDKADFLTFLCSRVLCVRIKCLGNALSYQIFETLNARGKSLSPLDLLRNKIFSQVSSEENLQELLQDWDRLYGVMKHVNGVNADTHIQTLFTIFMSLNHKSDGRCGRWLEPKDLFKELGTALEKAVNKESFCAELVRNVCSEKSAKCYVATKNPTQVGNEPEVSEVLNELKQYKIIGPLAYALFVTDTPVEVSVQILQCTKALIKRTHVLGNMLVQPYGQIFTEFASMLYLRQIDAKDAISIFVSNIREFDGTRGRNVLDDQSFVDQLATASSIKEDRAKDIFISLFYAKKETREHRLSLSSDLHLEHILPQTMHRENWPDFDNDSHHLNFRRLGNLMILSGERNTGALQRPFEEKLQDYYRGNDFWKVSYLNEFEEWTEEAIRQRQQLVANEVCAVWSLP